MALVLADRVKETASSPGTGTVTLLGASAGYQSFAAVGNGNTCYYTIADQDGINWEVGIGTYTASGTTLARTTVLSSSNSGSLVNFSSGTQDVFVTYPSEFSNTAQIGDVVLATNAPNGPGTWLETGKYYSKAAYPELASALGDVADFGTPATVPQAQLPQAFGSNSNSYSPYITATDGVTTVVVGLNGAIRKTTDGTNWVGASSTTTSGLYEVRYINSQFVAVGASGTIVSSSDGINWISRASAPTTNTLNSVAYGAGSYVAVGASGTIVSSTDLVNWTPSTGTGSNAFQRVIYANLIFVAVGVSGACYISSDGITWTSRSAGSATFNDVSYANSIFVAVGNSGACYSSTDGITWTSRSAGANAFYQVVYVNGLFISVGNAGSVYTSTDGITWTAQTTNTTRALYSVSWDGTTYVVAGANGIYLTSTNGTAWTPKLDESCTTFYAVSVINSKTIAFGNKSSVVVAGSVRAEVLTSGTWGYTLTAALSATNPRVIAYNGSNLYIAVGYNGTILSSSNGLNWTGQYANVTTNFDKVAYLNGNWIAMGGSGSGTNLLTSPDGITWTACTAGTAIYNYAAYGAGVYVVAGASGAVYSSPDLVTWTLRSAGGLTFNDVIFANSIFVAIGAAGACYSSTDGITWISRSAGSSTLQRIIYANSLFVAVGASGNIYTSPNGTTWTSRTSNVSVQLNDVVWSGSLFVAVGASCGITISSDGINWTNRTPGDTTYTLLSVAWGAGKFIVTSTSSSAICTSVDGINWTRADSVITFIHNTLYTLFAGNKFISIGDAELQTSTDGYEWTLCNPVAPAGLASKKIYKNNGVYSISTSNGLFYSTDGTVCLPVRNIQTGPTFVYTAYNGVIYVTVSSTGLGHPISIYTSTDGITWTRTASLATSMAVSGTSVTAGGVVFANGKFILIINQPQSVQTPFTIYTSTDGILWTGVTSPYSVAPSSIASDGITAVISSSKGCFKSLDGGSTWTQLTSTDTAAIVYSNGAWVFNTLNDLVVSPDLATFYSTGIVSAAQQPSAIYVSGNLISSVNTQNKIYINKRASGYVALPSVGNTNISYTAANTEVVLRGTTALLPISPSNATYPFGICETPLYSYDTSTTFWVPPSNAGVGQQAYIYAGA